MYNQELFFVTYFNCYTCLNILRLSKHCFQLKLQDKKCKKKHTQKTYYLRLLIHKNFKLFELLNKFYQISSF